MLVGRDADLSALAQARRVYHDAAWVSWIVGPDGVGKSALARAAIGPDAVTVDLYPDDVHHPLGAVTDLTRQLGGTIGNDPAQSLLRAVEAAGPTRVLIDDAHWMDTDSQRALWQVARRSARLPVWVVLTTNPDPGPFTERLPLLLSSGQRGQMHRLQPLDEMAVAEFLRIRLGIPIEGDILRQVMMSTGGYPALLVSLVAQLPPQGHPDGLTGALQALTAQVPDSGLLSRHASQALDGTSPSLRYALIGLAQSPELTVDQLAGLLAALDLPEVSPATLIETGLVDRSLPGRLQIRHRPAQEAVLDRATVAERRATHRALAKVLDGVAALEHRTLAAEPAERGTLCRELETRIEDAQMQGDLDLAYRLSLLGLRLEKRFLDDVVLAIVRSGRIARLRDLSSHISNLPSSVTRACALALLDLDRGVFRPATARLGNLDLASITDLRELLILAYTAVHVTAQAAMQTAPETAVVFDPIVAALREQSQQAPPLVRYELTALALALEMTVHDLLNTSLIPEERIPGLTEKRDFLAAQPGSELLASATTVMLGILEFAAGQTGRSLVSLSSGSAQIPVLHMQATVALIFIRFNAGEWDQADALASRQLGTTLDMLQQPYWHQAFALAALIPACRGESEVVRRYLSWEVPDQTVSLADACLRFTESWAHVCQKGVTPELARLVGPLWDQDLIGYIGAFPTTVLLVGSLLAGGYRARAVGAIALAARAPYEAAASAYAVAHCDGLLAVHDGRLDEAEASFALARWNLERQVAENPSGGLRLYQALLAEDSAALARLTGRTPETLLADLRSAHALLTRCGALQWAERLNAHIVALGDAADPDPAPSLLSRLTTREREIALLVAEGLSNREIAERLFVTVRTAEYHVHNALTKTGLRSRHSLREALSSPNP